MGSTKTEKRFMRLEAKPDEDDSEFSPLSTIGVKIDATSLRSFNTLLKPNPDELSAMLAELIKRKNWTLEMTSLMLNISIGTVGDILHKTGGHAGSTARLVWYLCEHDKNPEMLNHPLYFATWGKSKGIRPKSEPKPKKIPKPKIRIPRILLPDSPWVYVDWGQPNVDIAAQLKVTTQTVETNRRRIKRLPRTMLMKCFGAVGRVMQVQILIRGMTRRRVQSIFSAMPKEPEFNGVEKL